jgi:hypothetical protein
MTGIVLDLIITPALQNHSLFKKKFQPSEYFENEKIIKTIFLEN